MKNVRNFISIHVVLFGLFFVPHILLYHSEVYFGKLSINVEYGETFFFAFVMALIFLGIFVLAVHLSRLDGRTIENNIQRIGRSGWFMQLAVFLTASVYALLAVGIGYKQGNLVAGNALIIIIPRELLIVSTALIAFETRRFFWIVMVAINVLYWILVGSKAALLLPIIAIVYYFVLTGKRLSAKAVLLSVFGCIALVVSYFVPLMLRIYSNYGSDFLVVNAQLLSGQAVSMVAQRVSWFDGMFVTQSQFLNLEKITPIDIVFGALARLVPGVQADVPPMGQIVIPLFNANNVESFSGAVGMPGAMAMMFAHYNLLGLLGFMLLQFFVLLLVFGFIAAKDPVLTVIGMSLLVLCFKSMFISGNIDIAIGKMLALLITALFFTILVRGLSRLTRISGSRRSMLVR